MCRSLGLATTGDDSRLAVDRSHVRISVPHRRPDRAEQAQLVARQLDRVRPGVLLHAGDSPGARDWIRSVKRSPLGPTLRFLTAEVLSDPILADAWRERFVRQVRQR